MSPHNARNGPMDMQATARGITINAYSFRNFLFLVAIVLMNYTMSRPSPVDIVFLCALFASFLLNQRLTLNFFVYFFVISIWTLSFWVSSVNLIDRDLVMHELMAKTFAVLISLIACYTALSWNEANYHRFFKVYIFSACIAAVLGVTGFVTKNELFTWDERAKGLFDDPNMYSGFLIPAILGTLYMLFNGRRRAIWLGVLLLLLVGILFSFSRAATGSLAITGTLFLVFTFRHNLVKAGLYAFVIGCVLVLMGVIAIAVVDDFGAKLFSRLTVAKEYDSGHFGRYNRYLLSIPFILDNPLGMGIGEIDKFFPEPIHNIFISSFLNYGWVAGSAWLLLIALMVRHAWVNYRETRHPLAVLLFCCSFSQVLCAVLHQCEQWRSLWLFMGLHWGFTIRNFVSAPAAERPVARVLAPAAAPRPA
jgi:O-antigen ligase